MGQQNSSQRFVAMVVTSSSSHPHIPPHFHNITNVATTSNDDAVGRRLAKRKQDTEEAQRQQAQGGQGKLGYYASLWVWLGARQVIIRVLSIICAFSTLGLSIVGIVFDVQAWASWATLFISVFVLLQTLLEKLPIDESETNIPQPLPA